MTFTIVWDEQDPTIVRFDLSGQSNWEEAYKAIDKGVEFIQSKQPQRIDVIFDIMTAKTMPPGNPIPHFKVGFTRLTAVSNCGIICVVTQHGLPKLALPFMNLVMRLYGFDQKRFSGNFNTLAEARAFIAKDRAKAGVGS